MSESDEIGMNPPATTTHDEHRSEQGQEPEDQEDSELQQEHEHEEEDEDDEEEFSFVCVDPETSSSISADDIFHDGQIRPLYPLFNQSLIFDDESDDHSTSPRPQLRNIFIEHPPTPILSKETPPTGTFCDWSASSKSPDKCKKSNSTGFSKLRRFRDLLHRSTSDGKDTFVFLHIPSPSQQVAMAMESGEASSSSSSTTTTKGDTNASVVKSKVKGVVKSEKHVSAHERHYMRNRVLKEEEKRRSYLPYKVGFFTSASGLSRNVHPF